MAKQEIKSDDKWVIDVDVIIDNYNKNNPDDQIDRKILTNRLECNIQSLTEWKQGRTPKLIFRILKMKEMGSCDLESFIYKNE